MLFTILADVGNYARLRIISQMKFLLLFNFPVITLSVFHWSVSDYFDRVCLIKTRIIFQPLFTANQKLHKALQQRGRNVR